MKRASLRKIGLVTLSGLLSIVIFSPYDLEGLAWVAFIPFFAVIHQESRKNAFWFGWGLGLIHFLGTLYWVTVAMALYGNIPKLISGVALLALAMYLALYIGLWGLLLHYVQQKTVLPFTVIAPVTWVGLEYLRSFFFIGFPWNLLGYCQYRTPQITQIADVTGVYGVSFLIVLVNAWLYTCFFPQAPRVIKIKTTIATLCCVGGCVGYSLFMLSSAETPSRTVRVAVVQGNIDQGIKWSPEHRDEIFTTYIRLSKDTLNERPELIVWPETAIPFYFHYEPEYRTQLEAAVRELGVYLLTGGADLIIVPPPERYRSQNSAFFLSPEGRLLSKYDKIQLVPFGEYVPYKKVLFFIDKLVTAIGAIEPGKTYQVMRFQGKSLSTVICFEIIFPNLVRKFVDRGAQLLITITNDAWYGRTAAPYQHFAMATFRAIENRAAVARAANTGISGFIDPYGRVIAQSDIFVEGALVRTLPLRTTTTFYTRYGDLFAMLCLGILIVWIGYGWYKWTISPQRRRERRERTA